MNIQIEIAGQPHTLTVAEARKLWGELGELFGMVPFQFPATDATEPIIWPAPLTVDGLPCGSIWTHDQNSYTINGTPITFTDNGDDEAAGAVA